MAPQAWANSAESIGSSCTPNSGFPQKHHLLPFDLPQNIVFDHGNFGRELITSSPLSNLSLD